MKLNTKTRYGIRTMVEIALKDPKGVYQKEIARNQNISFKYLDQIVSALKAADLITNLKGKKSGYVLNLPREEVTIYKIYRAFQPKICIVECLQENYQCKAQDSCITKPFWEGLNELILNYFKEYTLQDLIDGKVKEI